MSTDVFHNSQIRKVFIVSGGRTATTLFGNRFGPAFDDVFSIHEPDRIDAAQIGTRGSLRAVSKQGAWRMGAMKALGMAGTRNLSLSRLQGKLDTKSAIDWFLRDRQHLGQVDCNLYLEANYQLFGVIPDLTTLPNTHVILLLRDPSTWIQSWLKKKWYSKDDWLTRINRLGMKRITPDNIGVPDPGWQSFDRTEKLAWVWSTLTSLFLKCRADNPDRVSVFRYEDLVRPGDATRATKEDFLSAIFERAPSNDEVRKYDQLIGHKDNATLGQETDVFLPDWFLEDNRETLAQFDYA